RPRRGRDGEARGPEGQGRSGAPVRPEDDRRSQQGERSAPAGRLAGGTERPERDRREAQADDEQAREALGRAVRQRLREGDGQGPPRRREALREAGQRRKLDGAEVRGRDAADAEEPSPDGRGARIVHGGDRHRVLALTFLAPDRAGELERGKEIRMGKKKTFYCPRCR